MKNHDDDLSLNAPRVEDINVVGDSDESQITDENFVL